MTRCAFVVFEELQEGLGMTELDVWKRRSEWNERVVPQTIASASVVEFVGLD